MRRNQRGFNLVMMGIVIMAIVAAGFAVRHYWSGVLQQKYRQAADSIGKGLQFERGRSASQYILGDTWEDVELVCPDVRDHIEDLENQQEEMRLMIQQLQREVEGLRQREQFLRQRAFDLEWQAARLEMAAQVEPGLSPQQRENMLRNARALRAMALEMILEADKHGREAERRAGRIDELEVEIGRIGNMILQLRQEFPQCFN